MDMKTRALIGIVAGLTALLVIAAINISENDKKRAVHEHVRTKQFITRFKTAPVVFCKTEYKIVINDSTHADIVLPVILFPVMEEVE